MYDAKIHCRLALAKFPCHPGEITSTLGLQPTKAWSAGDVAAPSRAPRRISVWSLASRLPLNRDIDDHMADVLTQIEPVMALIRARPWGGLAEMACAVYVYGPAQPPLSIPATHIAAIASIGASLDIDLYQLPSRSEG